MERLFLCLSLMEKSGINCHGEIGMTPQEINEKLAVNIMGWFINPDNKHLYFKDKYFVTTVCGHTRSEFNPYENLNHTFMCLRKWRKNHPGWTFCVYPTHCELSNYEVEEPFISGDIFPDNHEAQAICQVLLEITRKNNES